MSERKPWLKFYPTDWRGDAALRACSLAARGLWIDLISIMHDADPYGHLLLNGHRPTAAHLGGMLGVPEKQVKLLLAELEDLGVFSRTDDGTIYSRRMVRDEAKAQRDKANGSGGGNPNLRLVVNGGVNPPHNQPPNRADNEGDKARATRVPEARDQSQKPEGSTHTIPVRVVGAHPRGVCDDPDFEAFWQRYPRRDDKGHARKAWKAALSRASPNQIIAGLERYQFSENPRFRPLPATWLNGERWLSEQQSEDEAILRAAGVPLDDHPIFEGRFRLQ